MSVLSAVLVAAGSSAPRPVGLNSWSPVGSVSSGPLHGDGAPVAALGSATSAAAANGASAAVARRRMVNGTGSPS